MYEVLDYTSSQAFPVELFRSMGILGVSRYISHPGGMTKDINRQEYNRIRNAGLAIVINFEDEATRALKGYSVGYSDGQFARAYCRNELGHPDEYPIIQSGQDFGVSASQFGAIAMYQRGFNAGNGTGLQGAYGPSNILAFLMQQRLISIAWQWKGGSPLPGINMKQKYSVPYKLPFPYDANDIVTPYYGQRPPDMVPNPPPNPGPPLPPPGVNDMFMPYVMVRLPDGAVWRIDAGHTSRKHLTDLATIGHEFALLKLIDGKDHPIVELDEGWRSWLESIPVV